ncbi:MAG: hypothetical protein JKY22_11980 [Flavobacteriaceae bacterium]|nr:hypothetical protein [Flavobacteriaceae bacterium]PCJ26465.1 MAG: hypothetical protein COA94_04990 [Rickettsiales bacterium]
MGDEWLVNSDHSKAKFLEHVEKIYDEHKHVAFTIKTGKQRTNTQNASMHKYCELLASELNEKGLDMDLVLSKGVSVPWNKILIKELMWRPVQLAMTDEQSTTKPKRQDYGEIYDVINKYIAERFGIYVPWPSREEMK